MFGVFSIRSSCRSARLSAVAFTYFVTGSVFLVAVPLRAANCTYTWAVSTGDWSIASNWASTILPTSDDAAFVANGGTLTVTQPDETCGTLSLGSSVGSGAVQMTGGNFAASYEYVGDTGTGNISQCGGINNDYGSLLQLYLGYTASGNGMYNLSGSGQLSAYNVYIGYSGSGALVQSGGTNSGNGNVYIGQNAGACGTYDLSGNGQLSAYNVYIGYSGTGALVQSGGTTNVSGNVYIGQNAGACGTYNLSGQGLLTTGYVYVGSSGTGSFVQSGGTVTASNCCLGSNAGSSGAYNLTGSGQLSVFNDIVYGAEYIGYHGTGIFTQSGGTNTCYNAFGNIGYYGQLFLGYYAGSSGTYNLSGSGQLLEPYIYVGYNGTGTFTQSGGSNMFGQYTNRYGIGYLYLGFNAGSSGIYTLSGGQLSPGENIEPCYEYVGDYGTGSFTQSGGTNGGSNSAIDLTLGYNIGSSGTYVLSGNALLTANGEFVGLYGTGIFTQTAGSNMINNSSYFQPALSLYGSGSAYNLSGSGLLSAVGETVADGSTFTQTGGTNAVSQGNYGQTLTIGYYSNGTYSLSGSGLLTAYAEEVGVGGIGILTQTGGTNSAGNLAVNAVPGTCYSLSGSGQLLAQSEYVSGTFSHCGGTNRVSGSLNNDGVYNLSGSALLAASDENVGYSGTGVFTQSGGTNMAGALCLGYSSGSSGTYNLNGGLLNVTALSRGSGAAAFNCSGGTLQAGSGFSSNLPLTLGTSGSEVIFDTAGFVVTLVGSLSGPGGLTVVGGGELILSGSDSYSGGTEVEAGTLVAMSSASLPGGSSLTIGADATSIFDLASARAPAALTISAVPEPATLTLLLGAGAVALIGWGWRRSFSASGGPAK